MEIQVKIDPACREPKVLVCTHAMTDEVQAILQALAQAPPQLLPGFREGTLELLEPQDLLRGLLGVPLGIALGHIISLLASLGLAGGEFSPCVPSLVQAMGSEVAAVALQTGLSGLLGAAFGAGSVVWSLDHWSLVKQTGVYFLIGSLAMLPIAYLAHWMEHSLRGILGYFLIYLAIFAGIWAIQYLTWRRRIGKLNQKLE